MKVFVYGTLKRGKGANDLLKGAKFLGTGVAEGYDMYIVSHYPGVVKGTRKVRGEIYEVDEETLKELDYYEGVPHLYGRELTEIILDEGGKVKAYIYVYLGDTEGLEKADVNEKGEYEF